MRLAKSLLVLSVLALLLLAGCTGAGNLSVGDIATVKGEVEKIWPGAQFVVMPYSAQFAAQLKDTCGVTSQTPAYVVQITETDGKKTTAFVDAEPKLICFTGTLGGEPKKPAPSPAPSPEPKPEEKPQPVQPQPAPTQPKEPAPKQAEKPVEKQAPAEPSPSPQPSTSPTGPNIQALLKDAAGKAGKDNAPVVFVQYSDYQCPFCGRWYADAQAQLMRDYVDNGQVLFVYKDYPLPFYPEAEPAALAARCAGDQGRFWEMHDKIFANQGIMSAQNYKAWAKAFGLNESQFDSCRESKKYLKAIQANASEGTYYGVNGTPSFFVGKADGKGTPIVGAQPYSVFKQAIDQALGAEETPAPSPTTTAQPTQPQNAVVEMDIGTVQRGTVGTGRVFVVNYEAYYYEAFGGSERDPNESYHCPENPEKPGASFFYVVRGTASNGTEYPQGTVNGCVQENVAFSPIGFDGKLKQVTLYIKGGQAWTRIE